MLKKEIDALPKGDYHEEVRNFGGRGTVRRLYEKLPLLWRMTPRQSRE
jgi:hypothetical protein